MKHKLRIAGLGLALLLGIVVMVGIRNAGKKPTQSAPGRIVVAPDGRLTYVPEDSHATFTVVAHVDKPATNSSAPAPAEIKK